jgi:signal transduction histidine kinase
MKSIRCLLLMFAAVLPGTRAIAEEPRNILILHMENAHLPGNALVSKTIEQTIGRPPAFQYFDEYMDENRLGTDFTNLATSLQQKYSNQKIDLVISAGPPAMRFVLQYGDQVWPGVPKVFCVVDGKLVPAKLPADVTGTAGSLEFAPSVDLALAVQPGLQHLFYIGGGSAAELARRQIAEREFQRFAGKLDIAYLNELSWAALLARIADLPEHSAVLFTTYFTDGAGRPFITAEACRVISATSNAPVYAIFDTELNCGIMGGSIFSLEKSSRAAAKIGLKVLSGEAISRLPVEKDPPNALVVVSQQLAKFGLSDQNVPSGTVIIGRQPGFWERSWKWIAAIAVVVLLQKALIIYLLLEKRKRQKSEQALRDMTKRVIEASEEERRHIARELHDDFSQRLSLISFQIESLGASAKPGEVASQQNVDEPLDELQSLMTDIHDLSHRLHSSKLEHLGLKVAMTELCRQMSQKNEMRIELQTELLSSTPPKEIALCLYRVAQEALNNVVKHSGAKLARVVLSEAGNRIQMEVTDLGRGFDPGLASRGLGLTAMAERVRMMNGELKIRSELSVGTTITTRIPLPPASDNPSSKEFSASSATPL